MEAAFSTNRHELRAYIMTQGRTAIEARQVCRRMRELLRLRLQRLVDEYRQQCGVARATRKALTDPRYLAYIEQVVDVCARAQAARIHHETHLMYHGVL